MGPGPAGLAETAQQHLVGGLEKNRLGRQDALDRPYNGRQLFQLHSFANVHHQRGAFNLRGLPYQFGKMRDQADRQVIYAVVTEVLKSFQDRGLAGTAHAGNDDHLAGVVPLVRKRCMACRRTDFGATFAQGHPQGMLAGTVWSRQWEPGAESDAEGCS